MYIGWWLAFCVKGWCECPNCPSEEARNAVCLESEPLAEYKTASPFIYPADAQQWEDRLDFFTAMSTRKRVFVYDLHGNISESI